MMLFRSPIICTQIKNIIKSQHFQLKNDYSFVKYFSTTIIKRQTACLQRTTHYKIILPVRLGCFAFSSIIGIKLLCVKKLSCDPVIIKSPQMQQAFDWRKIFYLIYLDIWHWLGAIVAAICVAYVNIQLPLSLGDLANIIATFGKDASSSVTGDLHLPAVKLIGLYLAQAFGTLVYISLLSTAGENLAVRLKLDLYEALIHQDIAFYDERRTGELIDCLFTDIQEFKSSFKQCISQGLKNIIQICGCVVSLFKISPPMTYTILAVVPAIIATGSLFGMILRKTSHAAQAQSVKTFTMCDEVLSNIRTVRYFSNETLEFTKFEKELDEVRNLNAYLGYGIGVFQAGTNLFLNGLVLGTLCIGSRFVLSDHLPPGHLMSFLVTTQIIQKSFAQLSLTFGNFVKGKQAFQRVCFFSDLKSSIPISGGIHIPFHSFIPVIEYKNVTFSYPTRPQQIVLKDFNLKLLPGKTVAIVGASGNGKSTIALLLERFYDVNNGSITISNIDVRSLDLHWLRGTVIGIINQEPILFATTIKENIRYGKPDASDDEVYDAAKQANAHEFILTFPDGYDTVVGERGIAVSGGQKQRIAIARALIKQPAILILDEATSALDPQSEEVVQETLEKVCQGRTVLVIAHRLSTVRKADSIAVLNKGVILEMGSHEYLMKKKGAYYNLMNQQNLSSSRSSG